MQHRVTTRGCGANQLVRYFVVTALVGATACTGNVTGPQGAGRGGKGGATGEEGVAGEGGGAAGEAVMSQLVATSGLRRLSRHEYSNTVRDLLQLGWQDPGGFLPNDVYTPFDNDRSLQEVSGALVEGAEHLATDLAKRAVANVANRDRLIGCKPRAPDDVACLNAFVAQFGRRAFRRNLEAEEVAGYVRFIDHARRAGNFHKAIELVIQAMLQDPEFLYRVEIGKPAPESPGLFRLTDWEVTTRLSYLLWGSTPDDELLDIAAEGGLASPAERQSVARRMLEDPRALAHVKRFHALWLGYHQLPHAPELSNALIAESDALVERVVFRENRAWTDLFTMDETFIGADLVKHYGLPAADVNTPVWVPYDGNGRAGILSHGSFLSVNGRFGDTSPVQRGILIRQRVACQEIPSPPPEVDADNPPEAENEQACKAERYQAHSHLAGCRACHEQIDPVGFGLENYDVQGRFRTHETDKPQCAIAGSGSLDPIGPFQGPAELGARLVESGLLDACLARRIFSFAMGKLPVNKEEEIVEALAQRLPQNGHRFKDVLIDFVGSKTFAYRQQD